MVYRAVRIGYELKVDSIPLNFLIPIPSTPLEHREKLKPDEIVRIVAIFRYINPKAVTSSLVIHLSRLMIFSRFAFSFL